VVDDTYEQFVGVIVDNRDMKRDEVVKIADGSIFTGRQAKDLGLVDDLGNLHDAIRIAGEMVGIEEYPKTVKERKRKISWYDVLTQRMNDLLELDESEKMMPKLQYIFK
jgi:protease-4